MTDLAKTVHADIPEVVFPKDGGRGAIVGTVQCPRCHKDLSIAIRHNTTVRIAKPPRKRKFVLEP